MKESGKKGQRIGLRIGKDDKTIKDYREIRLENQTKVTTE